MKKMYGKRFLGALIFLAIFAAAAAVVMLLWNWLMPAIIGWGAVSYLQAAGLLLLCKLLFGGFKGHGMHGCRKSHPHFDPEERRKIHEKLKGMSRDERREYIRGHMFGQGPCGPWNRENVGPEREHEGK